MISNGSLLNDTIINDLIKYHVKGIQITLDGPPEVHDSRRVSKNGVFQFNKIIENINKLLQTKKIDVVIRINVDKNNTGRQVEDTDNAYELYSDETLAADDKAYFMKVQDIVSAAVDEAKFNLTVDKMRSAMRIVTGENPVQTVEVLGDRYVLNKLERASILRHFIMGNDFSHFGLVNAVTRSSQDVADYNRATELERIGGTLLDEGVDRAAKKGLLLLPAAA